MVGRTNSELGDNAHLGAARGSVSVLSCVDRSRLLRVYLVRLGFPRLFRWPLFAEEASYLLVGLDDSRGGGGSAKFHDWNVALEPEFEGGGTSFGFEEDGFCDDVSVGGEHRAALGALLFCLAHEPGVSDGVVLFFGASASIGVAVVPLGPCDAPQESDEFASPDGACALFSVRLQVLGGRFARKASCSWLHFLTSRPWKS